MLFSSRDAAENSYGRGIPTDREAAFKWASLSAEKLFARYFVSSFPLFLFCFLCCFDVRLIHWSCVVLCCVEIASYRAVLHLQGNIIESSLSAESVWLPKRSSW